MKEIKTPTEPGYYWKLKPCVAPRIEQLVGASNCPLVVVDVGPLENVNEDNVYWIGPLVPPIKVTECPY